MLAATELMQNKEKICFFIRVVCLFRQGLFIRKQTYECQIKHMLDFYQMAKADAVKEHRLDKFSVAQNSRCPEV